MNKDEPGYYSILPASVRYDKNVCAHAKILYSEITALSNKRGYCWATNEYFASLYEVDARTIRRWMASLVEGGHIIVEIGEDNRSRSVTIYAGGQKSPPRGTKKSPRGDKKVLLNTKVNIKGNNKDYSTVAPQRVPEVSDKDKKKKILRKKADKVILHLNKVAGKNYKLIDSHRSYIMARLNEGFKYSDFIKVINTKKQDPYFISNPQYMRAATLFNKKNFDNYLNEDSGEYRPDINSSSPNTISRPCEEKLCLMFEDRIDNPSPPRLKALYENIRSIERYYSSIDRRLFNYGYTVWNDMYSSFPSFCFRYFDFLERECDWADASPSLFNPENTLFKKFVHYIETEILGIRLEFVKS